MKQEQKDKTQHHSQRDITRTQQRKASRAASGQPTETRPEGARYKQNPDHEHSSHKEGSYRRQGGNKPTDNES